MDKSAHQATTFREVALEYLDGLFGYAMSLTGNQVEAEDLVQETYLRALRAFGQLRPDSNLKSWLFTILRNVRLNQVRRNYSGPSIVDMDGDLNEVQQPENEFSKDPHASYVTKLRHEDVREAVSRLPEVYREVILLREFEDFSYQQIAEMLNCPTGTVMSRLNRAREKLKTMLEQWSLGKSDAARGASR